MNKNYMLLKATLTDGHYTSEDFLMVGCSKQALTPTPTRTIGPAPTPTQNTGNTIVLSASNNWTYRYNNFLVIRYVPVVSDSSVSLVVPVLDDAALPQVGQPAPLPLSAIVSRSGGKIGDLLFIGAYQNRSITLRINNAPYQSSINIGQIVF